MAFMAFHVMCRYIESCSSFASIKSPYYLFSTLQLQPTQMYSLWSLAVLRADQAGLELARALVLRPPGSPPVTLVGYSLGTYRTVHNSTVQHSTAQQSII